MKRTLGAIAFMIEKLHMREFARRITNVSAASKSDLNFANDGGDGDKLGRHERRVPAG